MEEAAWLERILSELKSADDARCYAWIEEMGREGYSCLIFTGEFSRESRGHGGVTYCQLRSNDNGLAGSSAARPRIGVQVQGTGPAATRMAIGRAYLAFRLRSSERFAENGESSLLPREA